MRTPALLLFVRSVALASGESLEDPVLTGNVGLRKTCGSWSFEGAVGRGFTSRGSADWVFRLGAGFLF